MQKSNGEITEDKEKILNDIFLFYLELYRSEREVEGRIEERERALNLITKKISVEDNSMMIAESTKDEVEKLVMVLSKEKSPGLDGVTAEILVKFWHVMKRACVEMIKDFWRNGRLTTRVFAEVIKLIPKNHEVLLNWCP